MNANNPAAGAACDPFERYLLKSIASQTISSR
jgi:hypothetical protein